MPLTTSKQSIERVIGREPYGVGEPVGEPAPSAGILERLPVEMREKLPDELVDELLAGAKSEEEVVGPAARLLTKRLVERAMEVSRGLSTRDIEALLEEIYGVKVGRDLISRLTDEVSEDVKAWQQRPLDDLYPVVFLDALVLKRFCPSFCVRCG